MMKAAPERRGHVERLDEGEWLYELLADIRSDIFEQPRPQAVARIRSRVLSVIERPARAAA